MGSCYMKKANPLNMALNLEELINHCVHECHPCNQKLTEIFIHLRQVNCKHKWEKLSNKSKGCRKCLLTRPNLKKKRKQK